MGCVSFRVSLSYACLCLVRFFMRYVIFLFLLRYVRVCSVMLFVVRACFGLVRMRLAFMRMYLICLICFLVALLLLLWALCAHPVRH